MPDRNINICSVGWFGGPSDNVQLGVDYCAILSPGGELRNHCVCCGSETCFLGELVDFVLDGVVGVVGGGT